jgi:hypothetical protein
MTEAETWKTVPGRIIDMFLWTREYDERLHGFREGSVTDGGE